MGYSIKQQLLKLTKEWKGNHPRYKSWEHCYGYFQKLKNKRNRNEHDYDLAALHLGCYLSSWGMYRGSAFLLQNNYQVHIKPAKKILKNNFLWTVDWGKINDESIDGIVNKILKLIKELKKIYQNSSTYSTGKKREIKKWDTLPTKILLGTTGAIPAYDDYFMKGLGKLGITKKLGETSLKEIIKHYQNNSDQYSASKKMMKKNYPQMKLVDMFFYSLG